MPRNINPDGRVQEGLINREKLFDIVRNYEIRKLKIEENDDGSHSVSFVTLSRSQQDGQAAANNVEGQDSVVKPAIPDVAEAEMPSQMVPERAARTKNVTVRVAMDKEKDIRDELRSKYPKTFLENIGLA